MRGIVLGLVLTTLVSGVSAAGADPSSAWSGSQSIPGAQQLWDGAWTPLFGFTSTGAGVAVLVGPSSRLGVARFDGATGRFGWFRVSGLGGVSPQQLALYGRDGVLLGGQDAVAGPGAERVAGEPLAPDAAVVLGSVTGHFARRQVLARGRGGYDAEGYPASAQVTALAANRAGDAAVIVSVPVASTTAKLAAYRPELFVRRRGQPTFRRLAVLGRRQVRRYRVPSVGAVAVDAAGDVLAAWADRNVPSLRGQSVYTQLFRASGRHGRGQRLGAFGSTGRGGLISAALETKGGALVAWLAQGVGGLGYAGGPGTVSVASAAPGKAFDPARVVEHNLPRGEMQWILYPGVQAALHGGRGVVAWTGFADGRFVVRTLDVTAGGLGATKTLTPAGSDASLQGLGTGPHGDVAVDWFGGIAGSLPSPQTQDTPAGIYAAARAAWATAWGSAELVASGLYEYDPHSPQIPPLMLGLPWLATDPDSGRTVLLWSVRQPEPTTVQYSVRPTPTQP